MDGGSRSDLGLISRLVSSQSRLGGASGARAENLRELLFFLARLVRKDQAVCVAVGEALTWVG